MAARLSFSPLVPSLTRQFCTELWCKLTGYLSGLRIKFCQLPLIYIAEGTQWSKACKKVNFPENEGKHPLPTCQMLDKTSVGNWYTLPSLYYIHFLDLVFFSPSCFSSSQKLENGWGSNHRSATDGLPLCWWCFQFSCRIWKQARNWFNIIHLGKNPLNEWLCIVSFWDFGPIIFPYATPKLWVSAIYHTRVTLGI